MMKEFNDSLFTTKKKPPHVHFNAYNSYKFETPDNTGTGSNFKGMIVYDLDVLFTTALPALVPMIFCCLRILGKTLKMESFVYTTVSKSRYLLPTISRKIVDQTLRRFLKIIVY